MSVVGTKILREENFVTNDQIKRMDQNYDGSINSEYANIGGNRKETFNIRTNRYYGFRVASGPIKDPICQNPTCGKPITGQRLTYNGAPFHYGCAFK